MATIRERRNANGKTSFEAQVRIAGHPPVTKSFPKKTTAKRWAEKTEADIREGRNLPSRESQRHTLGDLVDRYIADVLPSKRDQTHPKGQLGWWKKQIGKYRLSDITPAMLAECRDRLRRTLSPATTNRYLANLSSAFTVAVKEWQWLESNPMQKIRKGKEPRGRDRYLDDDERKRFLAACKASPNALLYPAVLLSLSTGARRGEALGLTWGDIDLGQRRATLRQTKNGEVRRLPLTKQVCGQLSALRKVRRIDTDLVFPRPDGKEPVELRHWFAKAKAQADIKDFRWHDLRHSTASYLAMNGATASQIAAVLGHKTLAMVKRYAHLSDSHIGTVVDSMNRKIFE